MFVVEIFKAVRTCNVSGWKTCREASQRKGEHWQYTGCDTIDTIFLVRQIATKVLLQKEKVIPCNV